MNARRAKREACLVTALLIEASLRDRTVTYAADDADNDLVTDALLDLAAQMRRRQMR